MANTRLGNGFRLSAMMSSEGFSLLGRGLNTWFG